MILRRVEMAEQLLKETDHTITDIAAEVGYGPVPKFIAIFKGLERLLLSDYRSEG